MAEKLPKDTELFIRVAQKAVTKGLVTPSQLIQGATVEVWTQKIGTHAYVTKGLVPPGVSPVEVGMALAALHHAVGEVLEEARAEVKEERKNAKDKERTPDRQG